jgi:hypothetical protein
MLVQQAIMNAHKVLFLLTRVMDVVHYRRVEFVTRTLGKRWLLITYFHPDKVVIALQEGESYAGAPGSGWEDQRGPGVRAAQSGAR